MWTTHTVKRKQKNKIIKKIFYLSPQNIEIMTNFVSMNAYDAPVVNYKVSH